MTRCQMLSISDVQIIKISILKYFCFFLEKKTPNKQTKNIKS